MRKAFQTLMSIMTTRSSQCNRKTSQIQFIHQCLNITSSNFSETALLSFCFNQNTPNISSMSADCYSWNLLAKMFPGPQSCCHAEPNQTVEHRERALTTERPEKQRILSLKIFSLLFSPLKPSPLLARQHQKTNHLTHHTTWKKKIPKR